MKNTDKNKLIINDINIFGVKNPKLVLTGKFLKYNSKLVFEVDGKNIKPSYEYIGKYLYFEYQVKLNNSSKKIKIYFFHKGKKELLLSLRTNIIKRGIYKSAEIIKEKSLGLIYSYKNNVYYDPMDKKDYNKWLSQQESENYNCNFKYMPKISIILVIDNENLDFIYDTVKSIRNQIYINWELIIVYSNLSNELIEAKLKNVNKIDNRIKLYKHIGNPNDSKLKNFALTKSSGEYISFINRNDVVTSDALYQMIKILNKSKKLDFIYSDEDNWDKNSIAFSPNLKPDFSPDTLLSFNYIGHLSLLNKKIVISLNGFDEKIDYLEEYDLYLRISEKIKTIYHIPKILYHNRLEEVNNNDINFSDEELISIKKKIISNALKRRKIVGSVFYDKKSGGCIVNYESLKTPLVSIIIPTKDYASTLDNCLRSIYLKTTYKNYEVIVVNNRSIEKETYDLFEKYKEKYNNFKIVDADIPFNYSKINNIAAKKASGKYLLFLNNDTEIITGDYLEKMVGYAMQKHIGTVGAKLYYYDNTIQHAGIILGICETAGHAYVGFNRDDIGMYGRLCIPYNYSGVTAACMMVSKEKFNVVNGFNEKIAVAFNDVDFNLKLLDKGYYNVFLPQVELYHYESKSRGLEDTPDKKKRALKEFDILKERWSKYIERDPFYNLNFSLSKCFYLEKKNKYKK